MERPKVILNDTNEVIETDLIVKKDNIELQKQKAIDQTRLWNETLKNIEKSANDKKAFESYWKQLKYQISELERIWISNLDDAKQVINWVYTEVSGNQKMDYEEAKFIKGKRWILNLF